MPGNGARTGNAADYYMHSPTDTSQGPRDGTVRVQRSGSWHTWAFYARSAFRNWNSPRTRYPLVGFRLLCEMP
jgi:sulfatase modifying factor 1